MTETEAVYRVSTDEPAPRDGALFVRHHTCPKCKLIFGTEWRTDNNGVVLRIGIVELKNMAGICQCGRLLYWTAEDAAYHNLMRDRRRARRAEARQIQAALDEIKENVAKAKTGY